MEPDPTEASWAELMELVVREGRPVNLVPPRVLGDSELRRIRIPMLLLVGDQEVIYEPLSALKRAQERMPELVAALVPGANHHAAMTRPDEVNDRVLAFLARLSRHAVGVSVGQ